LPNANSHFANGRAGIYVRKVTAKKFHPARLSFGQVRAGKNCFRHVRIPEISSPKVCAAGKVCAGEPRFSEVGSFEVDVSKDSAAKVHAGQISVRKVRAGQVGPRAAILAAEKAFVRFQNFCERFSVVLDTFGFLSPITLSAIENVWRIVYSMWRS